MNTRHRWLALALVVTVAAAFWPAQEDDDAVIEPVRKSAHLPSAAATTPMTSAAQPAAVNANERMVQMQANLFPQQTWAPPPPKPKPYLAPPPPPPRPPPLPFKYLGRWVEDGKKTLFLAQGEQPIPIKQGQVLSGSWRVDEITDRAVVFTYLPLDMQSILGITP